MTTSHKINYNYDYEEGRSMDGGSVNGGADSSKGSSALIGGVNLSMGVGMTSTFKNSNAKTRSMKEHVNPISQSEIHPQLHN